MSDEAYTTTKLATAQMALTHVHQQPIYIPPVGKIVQQGYQPTQTKLFDYHEMIKICRWFYTFDPIAGTVIERMSDMSITELRNRRKGKRNVKAVDDVTLAYYNAVARILRPFYKQVALEYFIHGMAVPDYTLERVRGDILSEHLGRKRVWVPTNAWVRNPENIILKRRPVGINRNVYLRIPSEDIAFVKNKGRYTDGNYDPEGYQYLLETFPEYVRAINAGLTTILLNEVRPILRKPNSYADYPTPFLTKAIKALQHKEAIKQMDRSIANRAIEAIRHIKVGDKDFPALDDDITAIRSRIEQGTSSAERVYNLITNHTVSMEWSLPPLDSLLDEAKYAEPNADIFLGLGFPRILTVGETLRSNASDSKIAALGPKSTLEDLRDSIVEWTTDLYRELAERNDFTSIPEPYFTPIQTSDYTALIQFAIDALNSGSISKNTVSQLYGTDYDTEAAQIEAENELGVLSPEERVREEERAFTREQQQRVIEQQERQQELAPANNREE